MSACRTNCVTAFPLYFSCMFMSSSINATSESRGIQSVGGDSMEGCALRDLRGGSVCRVSYFEKSQFNTCSNKFNAGLSESAI
jgi:hypothetical protein